MATLQEELDGKKFKAPISALRALPKVRDTYELSRSEKLNLEAQQGLRNEQGVALTTGGIKPRGDLGGTGVFAIGKPVEAVAPAPAPAPAPAVAPEPVAAAPAVRRSLTALPTMPFEGEKVDTTTGLHAKTLAGQLALQGLVRRDIAQTQLNTKNELAAYNEQIAAGAASSRAGVESAQAEQTRQATAYQAELMDPATTSERRAQLQTALGHAVTPSFTAIPEYDEVTGLRTGTSVLNQRTGAVAGMGATKAPPSQADLEHTAKLRGMTVDEVKAKLGIK